LVSAVAVGLGNFAVAIGIGLSNVSRRTQLKVGLVFGGFESGMPLVGLLIGHSAASAVGALSQYIGGGLIILTGAWTLWQAWHAESEGVDLTNARLLVSGLALSLDNLVVGFSLGVAHTNLVSAFLTFLIVSVVLCFLGLEFGRRLGRIIEAGSEYAAGVVLVVVGVLLALGWA
jgi:manganese efflux pump family protein